MKKIKKIFSCIDYSYQTKAIFMFLDNTICKENKITKNWLVCLISRLLSMDLYYIFRGLANSW